MGVVGFVVGLDVVGLDLLGFVVGLDDGLDVVGSVVGLDVVGFVVGWDVVGSVVGLDIVGFVVGLDVVGFVVGCNAAWRFLPSCPRSTGVEEERILEDSSSLRSADLEGWSMMILSHVYGPHTWRKSGYCDIGRFFKFVVCRFGGVGV